MINNCTKCEQNIKHTHAKFSIGDKVRCFRAETPDVFGFNFTGHVKHQADTGEGWEYGVSNAPLLFLGFPMLIWEFEMELAK